MHFLENYNSPGSVFYPQSSVEYPSDYPQREAALNYEISKLRDTIQDYKNQLIEKDKRINDFISENLEMKNEIETQSKNLDIYKETLRRIYVLYVEQQKFVENQMISQAEIVNGLEKTNYENFGLNQDKNNLLLERDMLIARLNENEQKYIAEITNLRQEIEIKIEDNNMIRLKLDENLDFTRKLENESSSLRFAVDNMRVDFENQLREKNITMEQMDRSFQESLDLKSREIIDAVERIRKLESNNLALLNDNKNLSIELSNLHRFQNQQINIPPQIVYYEKPIQNQQETIKIKETPQKNYKRDFSVSKETFKNQKDFNLHKKIEFFMDLYDKNNKMKIANLIFQIWKLKSMRKKNKKSEKKINKFNDFEDLEIPNFQNNNNKNEKTKENQSDFFNIIKKSNKKEKIEDLTNEENNYFRITTHGFIGLISFIRESINNIIFELFVRSINHANQRKLNSLILFILNLKELKEKYWKGLSLALEIYHRLRKIIKEVLPTFLINQKNDIVHKKLTISIGILEKYDVEFRDNINKWFEDTLSSIVSKKKQEKSEKNQELLYLFRLLTVKYRIRYPLRGKSFTIDSDLDSFLENKISSSLRKILSNEV